MTTFLVIRSIYMHAMSLAHAKAHLSELLNTVEAGEEVVITRHGRPVVRVLPASPLKQPLPLQRLAELRQQVPAWQGSSAALLRELRDTE
ncbi:MAG: type II toxin-antitoxin system prevent-host-death family antitoxin [Gallionella sp.]|nr:type II toxin-antitoxin system prevent-host-death family antitoxin [Gallionella sp.]